MRNHLNCRNFEQRIHQLLDDRLTLTGDAVLMEHAEHCDECLRLFLDYEAVASAIPLLDNSAWQDEQSLHSGVSVSRWKSQSGHYPVELIATLAASLLFVVFAVWNVNSPKTESLAKLAPVAAMTSTSPSIFSTALKSDSAEQTAILKSTPVAGRDMTLQRREKLIHKLVFYQPPTFVEMAQQAPQLVNSVQLPTAGVWDKFSKQLDPINPYLNYTAEFPGIRKVQYSVNMTLELLQRSLSKTKNSQPDLGWSGDFAIAAAI